ncbi:Fungal Zn(2)-Cys(6) binuclear cluster domain [Rhizoctonia solani]|uniref:Fungal Zn(2)-Cys(6) binuclear cluster domain n=1 Tax=Rhizoctonia solani TaxID=456999 RepID=A0A8H8P150_9AGAM|nr:Fungal Zn(2)-Cys(6) binuclear cluster domain [Rhizoctonia solani]QRW22623.1 Fungal Zn(2)-Cys(6) binuclear cluster domain [Rhizoctonia solani]
MPPRSTAGCYTCKRRKKKCDETQPFCTRCIRSGRQCEGYAPLESPDIKGIMRRGKATPAQKHVPPPRSSNTPESQKEHTTLSSPISTNVSDQPSDPQTPPLDPNITLSQSSDTDSAFPLSPPDTAPWQPSVLTSGVRYVTEGKGGGLAGRWLESLDPGAGLRSGDGEDRWTDTYGQETRAYETSWPMFHGDDQAMAPNLPSAFISEVAADEELEDDPEGAKYEMCTVPVLDANTVDNTLPFILECYARWIHLVIFEPSKAANPMKDTIIAQFMRSPDERPKMILLANVVGSLGRSLRYDARVSQLVDYLRTEAYGNIAKFLSDQPGDERERDRQSALAALDLMMEAGQSFRNPWLPAESFAGYPHPTILEANADYRQIDGSRSPHLS